jgi:probable phosphoglycerate mutase
MTLYIIRHGETDLNRLNIVQGSGVNSDLNNIGRKQAYLFFQYYKNISFDYIITSVLKRTHQTVEPFLLRGGANWIQMPELNEISWGINEGKAGDEMTKNRYDTMMKGWLNGDYHARIEGGESAWELAKRVHKSVEQLRHLDANNVLVCTHGRTLLCLMTLLQDEPLKFMQKYIHTNTGLYKLHRIEKEFHIELANDITHLKYNTIK